MTSGRRLIFACALLSLSAPAALSAAPDLALPATASFAYRHRHPVTALPASALDKIAGPADDSIGDEATLNAPFDPPAAIGIAPARTLSRSSVCTAVVSAARANDLPVPFFANLIWQESSFQTGSISPAGAQGIAQFMPGTARQFQLMNPFEPIHALFTAGEFLRKLASQFGNLGLAAAAYNAGPKRVSDWLDKRGGLPDETRDYVRKITGRPADAWTSNAFARRPDAALMPARAPCHAVAEEVAAQAKLVRVSHLMTDLVDAAAALRTAPDGKSFDEVAWSAATSKPGWQQRAVAMMRDVAKRIRDKETREVAAARHAVKTASRALVKVATDKIASKSATKTTTKTAAEPATKTPATRVAKQLAPAKVQTQAKVQAKVHEKLQAKIQDRVPASHPVTAHAGSPARRSHVASAR